MTKLFYISGGTARIDTHIFLRIIFMVHIFKHPGR